MNTGQFLFTQIEVPRMSGHGGGELKSDLLCILGPSKEREQLEQYINDRLIIFAAITKTIHSAQLTDKCKASTLSGTQNQLERRFLLTRNSYRHD